MTIQQIILDLKACATPHDRIAYVNRNKNTVGRAVYATHRTDSSQVFIAHDFPLEATLYDIIDDELITIGLTAANLSAKIPRRTAHILKD